MERKQRFEEKNEPRRRSTGKTSRSRVRSVIGIRVSIPEVSSVPERDEAKIRGGDEGFGKRGTGVEARVTEIHRYIIIVAIYRSARGLRQQRQTAARNGACRSEGGGGPVKREAQEFSLAILFIPRSRCYFPAEREIRTSDELIQTRTRRSRRQAPLDDASTKFSRVGTTMYVKMNDNTHRAAQSLRLTMAFL